MVMEPVMEYIVKIFQTIVILIGFFSLFSIIDIVFSNVKQSREFSVFEMFKFIMGELTGGVFGAYVMLKVIGLIWL